MFDKPRRRVNVKYVDIAQKQPPKNGKESWKRTVKIREKDSEVGGVQKAMEPMQCALERPGVFKWPVKVPRHRKETKSRADPNCLLSATTHRAALFLSLSSLLFFSFSHFSSYSSYSSFSSYFSSSCSYLVTLRPLRLFSLWRGVTTLI